MIEQLLKKENKILSQINDVFKLILLLLVFVVLKSEPVLGISKTNSDLTSPLVVKLQQTGVYIKVIKLYLGLGDKLQQSLAPTEQDTRVLSTSLELMLLWGDIS